MSHSVELAGIGMTFGTTRAVSDVSFSVSNSSVCISRDSFTVSSAFI